MIVSKMLTIATVMMITTMIELLLTGCAVQ